MKSFTLVKSYGLENWSMTKALVNKIRVSTDLTEQISRRFPGYSRRDF